MNHETLSDFIAEERLRAPTLGAVLDAIRLASMQIAALLARGRTPELETEAREAVLGALPWGDGLRAALSTQMAAPQPAPEGSPVGDHLLAFDPIEGAADVDLNNSVGSLFSVLRAPSENDPFLAPGTEQVAACYALYGPATVLVLTVGRGVQGYTLDRDAGDFVLTHPSLTIAQAANEFSVNASSARVCEPAVQRYVDECAQGTDGARGKHFDMRWSTKFVAEVHRLLVRGGVFLYPNDVREAPGNQGRVELLCQANPVAMLVEQAGGVASTGRSRLLGLAPQSLHERVGLILGAKDEVEMLERFHAEHDQGLGREFTSPLFNERSLFPTPTRR
jgi:fructose-1,6-bisphosphatase